MSDDTRRVLDLLAQGKITVAEADRLLHAVGAQTRSADAGAPPPEPARRRWVRIAVHKPGHGGRHEKDVTIRVPIAIVKSGMRLGALIPGMAGEQVSARLRERGLDIDFSKLDAAAIDDVLKELGDTNIEIDAGKAQVRITCE
jgi:SHOCT-like protein